MKLKCPYCKSTRSDSHGVNSAGCLRCKKIYYFELTPGGKRYRYFSDEGMNQPVKLKDADPSEFDEEIKIPPGMTLYSCKHPITREYKEVIAKNRLDAMTRCGWVETPDRTTWIMPIKVGKELKPEKEEKKPVVVDSIVALAQKHVKEQAPPKQKKKKREGPTLKQEILRQHITGKERFLEGTFIILKTRAEADGKPVDEDHLKKRAKLYFSMYRKELGL